MVLHLIFTLFINYLAGNMHIFFSTYFLWPYWANEHLTVQWERLHFAISSIALVLHPSCELLIILDFLVWFDYLFWSILPVKKENYVIIM